MNPTWIHRIQYVLLLGLRWILLRLDRTTAIGVGAMLGRIVYLMGIRRQVALDNLRASDLGLSKTGARRICRNATIHLGRTFAEILCLDRPNALEGCTLELDPSVHIVSGKGAVVASLHLGNWELLARMLVHRGVRLVVVVRRQANPHADILINNLRRRVGNTIVYEEEIRVMADHLEQGDALGLVADQGIGSHQIQTRFLGRVCRTARGPEYFVRKFRVPLYLAYGVRLDNGRHRFHLEAVPVGQAMDQDGSITQLLTSRIEEVVRRYPDQWLWHHRRWKNALDLHGSFQ